MSKKQILLLLILLCGALIFVAWFVWPPQEQMYQNRPLSSWLKDLENSGAGDTNSKAFVAFQKMGTNAIPPLLNIIQSDGSRIQRIIMELNEKQSIVTLPYGTPYYDTMGASWALYAMGTNASPALPVLTNLLFHTNALIESSTVLAGIGSEAVPSLLTALTNKNRGIRHSAASGLGNERSDFDVVVPALIASLQDSSSAVQSGAVMSLGQLHVKPELAVPALINAFTNSDPLARSLILFSLGRFEVKAKSAAPLVIKALKDSDQSVRVDAGAALKKIDPEAAKKAGVE